MRSALISIKPSYVDQIVSGVKIVEIRRRRLSLMPGTRLWIYSTRPAACINAVARVQSTETDTPNRIWERIANSAGVSEERFFAYCNGLDSITAVHLRDVKRVEPALSLAAIRTVWPQFHPPQFFSWLPEGSELLKLLEKASE